MGAVLLGILGVAVLVAGVKMAADARPSDDSVELTGTVTEVRAGRTSSATSRSKVYYPTVRYWSPATGADDVFTPTAGSAERFKVGQDVTLVFDRQDQSVSLRSVRRRAEEYGIAFVGLVMIAFAVLEFAR